MSTTLKAPEADPVAEADLATHFSDEAHHRFHDGVRAGTTYRKAVVSFRLDDGRSTDISGLGGSGAAGLLQARGFVAGLAINSANVGNAGSPSWMTFAQIKALQDAGFETMAHSRTHGADPTTLDQFRTELFTCQDEMRAQFLWADAAVQPGTWVAAYNANADSFTATQWWHEIRTRFANYEAYLPEPARGFNGAPEYNGNPRALPRQRRWGNGCANFSDGAFTLAAMKACVDLAVKRGGHLPILAHSFRLDQPTFTTLADFTALLDYVKAYKDAGQLDTLTPTGAIYATQAKYPAGIFRDPHFLDSATGAFVGWEPANSPTVVAATGITVPGTGLAPNALLLTHTNDRQVYQRVPASSWRTGRLVFYAKPNTGGTAGQIRAIVRNFADGESTQYGTSQDVTFTLPADVWTQCELPASSDPRANVSRAHLLTTAGSASDGIQITNADLYKR